MCIRDRYTTSLLSDNQKKIMIDSDVNAMKKWLEVDRFPLAKYPSKFAPTLMQQLAINIAISEKDRDVYKRQEIECCDRMGLCSVEYKEDLECKKEELVEFCSKID